MKKPDVLRKQEDFTRLYKKGRSTGSRHLVLLYRKNGLSTNRKAFLASKKVGNSVVRHRTTRLIREAVRLHEKEFLPGHDIVFVARVRAKEIGYFRMEAAMLHLMKKAGIRV